MDNYKFYAIIKVKLNYFLERRLIMSSQHIERKSLFGKTFFSFQDQVVWWPLAIWTLVTGLPVWSAVPNIATFSYRSFSSLL